MTKMMRKMMFVALMLLALAIARPLEVEAMPRPCGRYAWTTTDMIVRDSYVQYEKLGNPIGIVPAGSEVVVETTDDMPYHGYYWARISYGSLKGYMASASENYERTFLEFQKWNYVEGTSGWVRLLRDVELHESPNPEFSPIIALMRAGEEVEVESEMCPEKHGSNVCRVWWNEVFVGYIPANNQDSQFYEYIAVPDDYVPATAPTQSEPVNKRGIVTKAMNLRQYPTTNSEIFRVLNTYKEVWVESLETNVSGEKWYRVNIGTMSGYVAEEGICVGQTLDRYAQTTTAVNLRSGPSTNSQILVTIPNGYKVWAVTRYDGSGNSQNPDWEKISVRINGVKHTGYVVKWSVTG